MPSALKWTDKVKKAYRHNPGEWTACKVSNRIEIRTKLASHVSLIVKVEDRRMRRHKPSVGFVITMGAGGKLTVTLTELHSLTTVVSLAQARLDEIYNERFGSNCWSHT